MLVPSTKRKEMPRIDDSIDTTLAVIDARPARNARTVVGKSNGVLYAAPVLRPTFRISL
jgi:hypothetical protein